MNRKECQGWLVRAESNLRLAKGGNVKGVVYEDLCFEAQQAAEKAIKALLIHYGDEFPKVHSFSVLLERLQKYTVVPPCVEDVLELSDYAIQTRYPGDYYPVTEEEYRRAIGISQAVFKWVQKVIRGKG
jgi:HEPN domain-containing protein